MVVKAAVMRAAVVRAVVVSAAPSTCALRQPQRPAAAVQLLQPAAGRYPDVLPHIDTARHRRGDRAHALRPDVARNGIVKGIETPSSVNLAQLAPPQLDQALGFEAAHKRLEVGRRRRGKLRGVVDDRLRSRPPPRGAAATWCTLARVEDDGLQAERLEPLRAREARDATADHADAPRWRSGAGHRASDETAVSASPSLP